MKSSLLICFVASVSLALAGFAPDALAKGGSGRSAHGQGTHRGTHQGNHSRARTPHFRGSHYRHWSHRTWSRRHGRYHYYDAGLRRYFYYDGQQNGFFPVEDDD